MTIQDFNDRLWTLFVDKEINSDEMRNAEDLVTHMIERRSRIDSKGEVSLLELF